MTKKIEKEWEMPETPEARKAIENAIKVEGFAIYSRELQAKEDLKEVAGAMAAKFDMPKPLFNKLVKTFTKAEIEKETEKSVTFLEAYSDICGEKTGFDAQPGDHEDEV